MLFVNRRDAGHQLAARLAGYSHRDDLVVLALPRGGVPVAFEVAMALDAPLDVLLVRKIGVPGHEELAMGAIASGGVLVRNEDVIEGLEIPEAAIESVIEKETRELARREQAYRDDRPAPAVTDRVCMLIDDGLATGASMLSAVKGLRQRGPASVVVAVPVAAISTAERFRKMAEDFVAVTVREPFFGVGYWYEDFGQTTDEEVQHLLQEAYQRYAESAETIH